MLNGVAAAGGGTTRSEKDRRGWCGLAAACGSGTCPSRGMAVVPRRAESVPVELKLSSKLSPAKSWEGALPHQDGMVAWVASACATIHIHMFISRIEMLSLLSMGCLWQASSTSKGACTCMQLRGSRCAQVWRPVKM